MIDISNLTNKTENKGATPQGKLSAEEFNTLVNAVIECQETSVRSLTLNGQEVKFFPDDNGNVNIIITESSYVVSASIKFDAQPPYKVALGNDFISHIKISNKYVDGDSTIPATTACKLYIYHNNAVVDTLTVYDDQTIDYNWGKLFNEGANQIYIKLDNTFGDIYTSPVFEVNTIALTCSIVNFDETKVKTGESWELTVKVVGAEATVFILIDNVNYLSATQGAGATITYNITEGLTNGTHKVSVYAVATEDTSVNTALEEYEYIYADDTYNRLIIASSLKDNTSIKLYNILKVVYWAYLKDFTGTKTASISIYDSTKGSIIETTQNIEFKNGVSSRKIWDAPLFDKDCIGSKTIKISIDDTERNIPITISNPDYWLSEVEGCKVYLSSAGRSNTMDNVDNWSYNNYSITFPEDMEWSDVASGWNYDSDNNIALHLRKGKEISLNYQPFVDNPAFGNGDDIPGSKKGLTFSIELATRNCVKRDASVVRCIYNGVGFEFYANSMTFASATESITADYKEDTRVRIDLVIEGLPTTYTYYDYNDKTTKTNDEARMIVYVDGVYQQMMLLSSVSNFKQDKPQNITIGSEFCDIDIYCIRIYESALNMKDITTNYSFDTPNITDKIEIAKRCNVFDSKLNVSYSLLTAAKPELPIMIINMPELPTSKTRLAVTTTSYINPLNKDNYEKGNASFTVGVGNAEMGNQGTSSMDYPMPYRNFDWRIGKSAVKEPFEIGSQTYKKYPLYEGMPPIKKFTFKKDYASSEMCNNAICSAIFTDMACGIYKNYADVITPPMQDAIAQNEAPDKYRLGLKAIPIFMFQYNNNEYTPLGMFNFIPNKNEEEYLGFTKVGSKEYTFESEQRAQSWEIRDNNIFWDFHMTAPHKNADGTISNDIFKYYEAIYPKDSTSGVDDTDFGDATETILDYAINETKDLLRLHNWLVDCNQSIATGAQLSTPYTANNITYNFDTAEYRRAKFTNEYQDYLVLDQWILYYIWREQFWMYDSGSKNLQIHTYDGIHWGCHVRDCDTGLGTDNEGKLVFPPYLEDFDYIVDNEFVFNCKEQRPENSTTVLNGQLGSIWINLRDCFQNRIQSMYTELYTNSASTYFSYDDAIKYFENHQGQWSEALYNFGSKQYYGGAPYSKWISSGLGDKKNQRRYWLYYAFRYRMSKYHAASATNRITWRTFGSGSDLLIKPYCQLYVCLGFGAQDYATTKRYRCLNPEEGVLVKNEYITSVFDNVAYLFNGDLIVDLGNLYEFGDIGSLNLTYAKRLRYLRLGNHENLSYTNTKQQELSLNNCAALEYIDLTNCVGFGAGESQNGIYNIDLTNQTLLQELYCKGSSLSNITFPQTPSLHIVELGSNLTDLRLDNLTGLTTFSLENGSRISTIRIVNCGDLSKTLSYNIITKVIGDQRAIDNNVLKNVTITNIDWQNCSIDTLTVLCDLNANITGKITMNRAERISYEFKKRLIDIFGNIDDPNNSLYIKYFATEIKSILCDDKIYFATPGQYTVDFNVSNANGNNFVYKGISYELESNIYASIDNSTGIITVNYIGEEIEDTNTGPNANLTIKMQVYNVDETYNLDLNPENITTLTTVCNLNFWNRTLRVGDVVYDDGFTSSAKDVEVYKLQGRTPIGICFYIDENDPSLRLMFALKTTETHSYNCWGPNGSSLVSGKLALQDITESETFDIEEIPQTGQSGVNTNITKWSDIVYEDTPGVYKFITFSDINCLYFGGFNEYNGQITPVAKYFSDAIIKTRNRLLTDPGLAELNLAIPAATQTQTETNNLFSLLTNAVNKGNQFNIANNLACLYYPVASICYAYRPTQKTTLNSKFCEHNWFCPCMGDLLKIGYYLYNYYTGENPAMNKFKDAIDYNVLDKSVFERNDSFITLNESSLYNSYPYYMWVMRLNMLPGGYGRVFGYNTQYGADANSAIYIAQKHLSSVKILPICQF